MSSISTLEVAWKHYSWGDYDHDFDIDWDEPRFCSLVAKTNKLELLKWAREEKKCEWDVGTINRAAEQGNLEMVKYCVANEVSYRYVCVCTCCRKTVISRYSNTYTKTSKRLGIRILPLARLEMVIFIYSNILSQRKFDNYNEGACACAASGGHLEVLKYLHEEVKAPWGPQTANWAAHNGQSSHTRISC